MGIIFKETRDKFSALWIEKYRPTNIGQMILDEKYRQRFTEMLTTKEIPHLLLVGPPGTGKTTLAKIIMDTLIVNEQDVIFYNGSLDRGIDIIRNDIVEFCSSPPYPGDSIKIVFFDEADMLTDQAQKSLREVIERYSEDVRFIFTANYLHKIENAVQSRLQTYVFKALPVDNTKKIIYSILQSEKVTYSETDVNEIIELLHPDIRRIINELNKQVLANAAGQKFLNIRNSSGENIIKEANLVEQVCTLWANGKNPQIAQQCCNKIVKIVSQEQVDYILVYNILFDNVPKIALKALVGDYANRHDKVAFGKMHFVDMMWKGFELVQKYG